MMSPSQEQLVRWCTKGVGVVRGELEGSNVPEWGHVTRLAGEEVQTQSFRHKNRFVREKIDEAVRGREAPSARLELCAQTTTLTAPGKG